MTTSNPAMANDTELLGKCDAALRAKMDQVDLCELRIKYRDEEIQRVYKENEMLRNKDRGFFDNPAVWAALGVIAGAFIGARAVR